LLSVGVASVASTVTLLAVDDVITGVEVVVEPVSVTFSLTLCLQDEKHAHNQRQIGKNVGPVSTLYITCGRPPSCNRNPNHDLRPFELKIGTPQETLTPILVFLRFTVRSPYGTDRQMVRQDLYDGLSGWPHKKSNKYCRR